MRAALFLFGAAVYAWFLWLRGSSFSLHLKGLPTAIREVLTIVAAIVGGCCLAYAVLKAAKKTRGRGMWNVLAASAGCGVLGILLPTVCICLADAFLVALDAAARAPQGSRAMAVLIGFMSASVYSLGPAIASIGFGLLYGIVASVFVLVARPGAAEAPAEGSSPGRRANWALGVALASLATTLIPTVGLFLSIWGLVLGILAVKGDRQLGARPPTRAVIGIVISTLCLAFWLLGIVAYTGSALGWIHHDTVPVRQARPSGIR